jgi:hypothetical protein
MAEQGQDLELRQVGTDFFVGQGKGSAVLYEPRHVPASIKT